MELTTQEKADRWDALINCGRLRIIGGAKLGDPVNQHLGIELWATHPEPTKEASLKVFSEFVEVMLP